MMENGSQRVLVEESSMRKDVDEMRRKIWSAGCPACPVEGGFDSSGD